MPSAKESSSPFGKRLASNDKKTRDKAVKALKSWISHKKSFTDLEVMKLWKGLFYCMWLSDKPVIQQQLSDTLSSLVVRVPREAVMPFISAFWETMCSEWNQIDRLRMDKYYFFLRRFIYYSFKMLKQNNWDLKTVEEYTNIMINGPLSATSKKVPDSIRYHIIEVYLEELERAVSVEESSEVPSAHLLEPMFHLLGHTINAMVFRRVAEEIFEAILRKTAEADGEDEDEDANLTVFDQDEDAEDEDEEDEEAEAKDVEMAEDNSDEEEPEEREQGGEATESAVFDYDLIGIKKRLFAVGADKETVDQNRRKVYALYQAYNEFCPLDGDEEEEEEEDAEGEAPEEDEEEEENDSE